MNPNVLFLGVKGHVIAINKGDGMILWKTKLRSGFLSSSADFVTILMEGDRVYAHTVGELYCLDAGTGTVIWKNGLEGLGFDIATLAMHGQSAPDPVVIGALRQRQVQQSGGSNPGSNA